MTVVAALPAAADASSATLSNLGVWAVLLGLPVLLIAGTSFVKISIVLGMLRSAVGAQDVPPTMVITVLAAVLTLFVMAPVGEEMLHAVEKMPAAVPNPDDRIGAAEARAIYGAASPPLIAFLKANTSAAERTFYADLAGASVENEGIRVLLPAFATEEVIEAFWMSVLIFLPFLVLDLIVSTTLTAVGFSSLNPTAISLPLKLLLLVSVDGWHIIIRGMLANYVT